MLYVEVGLFVVVCGDHNKIATGESGPLTPRGSSTSVLNLTFGDPHHCFHPALELRDKMNDCFASSGAGLYFALSFCTVPSILREKHSLGGPQMDDVRFPDFMQRERERLHGEREQILNQQKDLENKLTEIDRELAAIDAYEAAKAGKAATPTQPSRGARKSGTTIKQSSARTRPRPQAGSRREALLNVIGENPNGLSRGEIFERMGLKGNQSAEKSVSNALTALTKNNQVSRREGKYVIGT
jgi:hypothetical protein